MDPIPGTVTHPSPLKTIKNYLLCTQKQILILTLQGFRFQEIKLFLFEK